MKHIYTRSLVPSFSESFRVLERHREGVLRFDEHTEAAGTMDLS